MTAAKLRTSSSASRRRARSAGTAAGPSLDVDLHGRVPHRGVLVVAQRLLEVRAAARPGRRRRAAPRPPAAPASSRRRPPSAAGAIASGRPGAAELVHHAAARGLLAGAERLDGGLDVDHGSSLDAEDGDQLGQVLRLQGEVARRLATSPRRWPGCRGRSPRCSPSPSPPAPRPASAPRWRRTPAGSSGSCCPRR